MIVYAQCKNCLRRFIIEFENEQDATEFPCDPCPHCGKQDVISDLKPSIVVMLEGHQSIWIKNGELVDPEQF
jgi:hypothetical protein